jgi:glutathione synthase/RimK-type ligase-like ATP-grasp enzyme
MPSGARYILICCLVLLMAVLLAGCITENIGEAWYSDGGVTVLISNTGEPTDTYIQITVYEIRELHQTEVVVLNAPVALQKGENRVFVPGQLEPGNYKLYVYLIQNHERRAAVIRDIVVP